MNTVTRAQLAETIYGQIGLSRNDSADLLETVLERMATALNAQTAEKSAQYAAHTERLEQRVRVLERIVTDRKIELSDAIEQLRDDHPLGRTPLNEANTQEIRS